MGRLGEAGKSTCLGFDFLSFSSCTPHSQKVEITRNSNDKELELSVESGKGIDTVLGPEEGRYSQKVGIRVSNFVF